VAGERDSQERLFETVYSELRAMARRQLWKERPDHSWQPTELVNMVFLKLFTGKPLAEAQARFFYAAVRNAMRELLIDHARKRKAMKRPDAAKKVPLDDVLHALEATQRVCFLDLHQCLERLKVLNTRQHDVVELRYLVGLPWKEIAAQLGVSVPTVEKDWQAARAWLRSQLERGDHDA
jgi:RNA polymerase sigma factor (TIGR02999 family)